MERNWREANMPKWARDSIEKEMFDTLKTVALSWPTETKPEPAPFKWVDYGNLIGEPDAGTYWQASLHYATPDVTKIEIGDEGKSWKRWKFRTNGGDWSDNKARGPLYYSERDALVALLWDESEKAAARLLSIRMKIPNT